MLKYAMKDEVDAFDKMYEMLFIVFSTNERQGNEDLLAIVLQVLRPICSGEEKEKILLASSILYTHPASRFTAPLGNLSFEQAQCDEELRSLFAD
ncbi:hypothetical protein AXF42_Ash001044 [Apostasia shenzhenica]|uniref:Uncharacterized protein n=1 Tax=Apostasia shenzhenica TaxID=1088818 RepID=A0A2I0ATS9_9ASPA|nr:hypothetical protein AXF42_Ash001044 [Apostasia shenzhenica]